jgi:signal transduction histidine kinase
LDLFALDAELVALEAALTPLQGHARLTHLPALAWQLRQRDGLRAQALADECLDLAASSALPEPERQRIQARMALLRGEIAWLNGDLDQALALCHQGQGLCYKIGDAHGQADAHMLEAQLTADRGQPLQAEAHWSACAHAAMLARDPVRIGIAQVFKARSELLRNIRRAETPQRFSILDPANEVHPCVAAAHNEYLGLSAALRGDFAESASYYLRAETAASTTGQQRLRIEATSLLGRSYARLNDHEASLDWMQRGLALARRQPWPWSLGLCLMHFGETLRTFGRLQSASELLHEAMQTLTPLASSRPYSWTLMFLARLERDMGGCEASLAHFRELGNRAQAFGHNEVLIDATLGEAETLSLLNRPKDGLRLALDVLEQARSHTNVLRQIDALKVLADMHARHRLPVPPETKEANAVLHYLNQAVALMAGVNGYTPPPELLEQIAGEYAKASDFARAYEFSQRAGVARAKVHGQEATDRAIAMQVHHQTERAQVEMAYHRQLAGAENRRALALQQTSDTLERLGQIGQEITAQLQTEAVFEALAKHAQALLSADAFAISLLHPDGLHLASAFVLERGERLPMELIPLSDPFAGSARCVRERRELVVHLQPDVHDPALVPGTLLTLSRLYAPLRVGEQLLGVMSVQSARAHAYGEREQTIFRTLCAYGAIALDNARAYEQLKQARAKLLAQDKLATLGSRVAGVAQELNSPLGNSLLIVGTLQHRAQELSNKLQAQRLRKAELERFAEESTQAGALLVAGLERAAKLVRSFTQLAAERPAEPRQEFDLHAVGQQLLRGLQPRVAAAGLTLSLRLPEDLMLDGYPEALTQVLNQLLDNALLHAYPDGLNPAGAPGQMCLGARLQGPGRVLVELQDDGIGMAGPQLAQLFEPFTATPASSAAVASTSIAAANSDDAATSAAAAAPPHGVGRGLGLFICHNIVTTLWGGRIAVRSQPGGGSCFMLDLPLHAPEAAP